MSLKKGIWIIATAGTLAVLGYQPVREVAAEERTPTTRLAPRFPAIEGVTHLHNAHRVTDKVISGAQPYGEEAFAELQRLGVKTIISVDGMGPNVSLATKYGMRYVHLPIGYDTVPQPRALEIAKAINELPGPIYVHCHHGKHRSAAAVAVACVYNQSIQPSEAEAVLQTFGTGLNYKGLWKSAREARPLALKELDELKVDYVEKAPVPQMAAAMVRINEHFEHLKATQKAGWQTPPDHPDLDPAHEALQLEELTVEIGRSAYGQAEPPDFHKLLNASHEPAVKLREALAARPINPPAADAAFKQLSQSCLSCHQAYRD